MTLDEINKVMAGFCLLPQECNGNGVLGRWKSTDFEVTLRNLGCRRSPSLVLQKMDDLFRVINVNLFLLEASGLQEMLDRLLDDTTPDTNICRHLPYDVCVESVSVPYCKFGESDMCRAIVLRSAEHLGRVVVYDYGDHYSLGCEDDEIDVRQEWAQEHLEYLCRDDCLSAVCDWVCRRCGEVANIQEKENGLAFDVRVEGVGLRVRLDYQDYDRALGIEDESENDVLWYEQCYDDVPLTPAKVRHLLDEALDSVKRGQNFTILP